MANCCDPTDTFWADQLTATKAMIAAYSAAILALTTGAQMYRLSTGQTDQMVTKANLATLRETRDSLLNDISVLEGRVNCSNTIQMVPGF